MSGDGPRRRSSNGRLFVYRSTIRPVRQPHVRAWGWVYLGIALADAGELGRAAEHLERSVQLCRAVPDRAALVVAQGHLAEVLLDLGRIDDAVALAKEADRLIRRYRMRSWQPTPARNALVHAYLTRLERGQTGQSLGQAREASEASLTHARRDRQAAPAAYRWRGSYEWLRGDATAADKWWQRSAAVASELGTVRELETTRRERARLESTSLARR